MRSLGSPHPLKTEKGGAASGSMKGGPARPDMDFFAAFIMSCHPPSAVPQSR